MISREFLSKEDIIYFIDTDDNEYYITKDLEFTYKYIEKLNNCNSSIDVFRNNNEIISLKAKSIRILFYYQKQQVRVKTVRWT